MSDEVELPFKVTSFPRRILRIFTSLYCKLLKVTTTETMKRTKVETMH